MNEVEINLRRERIETQDMFLELPFNIEACCTADAHIDYSMDFGEFASIEIESMEVARILDQYGLRSASEEDKEVVWYSDEYLRIVHIWQGAHAFARIEVPIDSQMWEEYDEDVIIEVV